MEPEFITFRKFDDVALADAMAGQFDLHGIEYILKEELQTPNPLFALNNDLSKGYVIQIKSEDFERANEILREAEQQNINDVEKDYYLFGFSDDELIEVLTKADEWNAFDVVLARKILADRGKTISEQSITKLNEQRLEDLKTPQPPQTAWIIIGYICAFAGGVLGLFIGWHLSTYKKTLPDGERVYEYLESDRKQGRIIFYISIVFTVLTLLYRLLPMFSA